MAGQRAIRHIEMGQDAAVEGLRGLAAVEANRFDLTVRTEKALEVIDLDGGLLDIAVEARWPAAGLDHVPQGEPVGDKQRQPLLVGEIGAGAEEVRHDRPEGVAGVGVVLLPPERFPAGDAAEDEDAGIRAGHRRKACNHQSADAAARKRASRAGMARGACTR